MPLYNVKKAWLINPWMDISFFIATPLAIVPAFHLLMNYVSFTVLKLGILSVSATGHHLPGLIRAYTDSAIFRQFRLRLILVPSLFILLTLLTAYFKLSLAFCILIVWSTWHGSMQVLGFLRIYDVKAGFNSAFTARLDFWMCLAWFVQVVLWSPAKKMSVLSSFYMAGGPLLSVEWARYFEKGWLALTLCLSAAYAAQLVFNRVRHGYFNAQKLLCMAGSIGFWAYCMVSVNNLIIGLILWEIFHDLQYNVFVWNYNRSRVARNMSGSKVEKFLFQADWRKLAFYSACIVAYGCIGLLTRDVLNVYQNQQAYQSLLFQIGNVFAASGLIHFYLDGFIWKVRDGKVQSDLGLQAGPEGYRKRPKGLHWVLLAVFFSVSGCLGVSEYFHLNSAEARSHTDNLADLVPGSGYANFMKASRLKTEGRADSAIVYFERAIRYDATYEFGHAFIADLKYQSGDAEGAVRHYEKAVALDPDAADIRANLAGLYVRSGRYEKAVVEFRRLLDREPSNADHHYQLAWSLLQLKKGLEAKHHLERTLALNPDQAKALNYLGMVEQALGNKERAQELYQRSLRLDSTYVHARENLLAVKP